VVPGQFYLFRIPFSWPATWKPLYFSLWDAFSFPLHLMKVLEQSPRWCFVSQWQFLAPAAVSTYIFQALSLQPHFPVPCRSSWTYPWHMQIQWSNETLNLQYLSMEENKSSIQTCLSRQILPRKLLEKVARHTPFFHILNVKHTDAEHMHSI